MTITYAQAKGAPLSVSEADGNIADLDERTKLGWIDIVSELYYRDSPATPIATNYKGGLYLPEFTANDTLEAFATFHIPHGYKPGLIYPHVHFVTKSTAGGVVRIGFEYTWARRHDSLIGNKKFQNTQFLYIDYTVAEGSDDLHIVAETPEGVGIDGSGIEVDSVILMRMFREGAHPNDTFAHSIWGICADLHIQVDRTATINRAPNFYA